MWVFSSIGFFSAVSGRTVDFKVDPLKIVVRARVKDHLIALIKKYSVLNGTEITQSTSTDYRFRIVVDKMTWVEVMMSLTEDIDYTNFKSSVPNGDYHNSCMRVWGVMHELQYRDERPVQTQPDTFKREIGHDRYPETNGSLYAVEEGQYGGYSADTLKLFGGKRKEEEEDPEKYKMKGSDGKKRKKNKSKRRGWFFGHGKTEEHEQAE
jgi:hypothetical protein